MLKCKSYLPNIRFLQYSYDYNCIILQSYINFGLLKVVNFFIVFKKDHKTDTKSLNLSTFQPPLAAPPAMLLQPLPRHRA